MFERILVPLDGSAVAEAAIGMTLRIAEPDSEIILVQAVKRKRNRKGVALGRIDDADRPAG